MTVVLERDVLDLSRVRQRALLPRLLRRVAAQTGQILNVAKAAEELSMDPSTAEDYTKLLEAVFLINRLPAWGQTLALRKQLSWLTEPVEVGHWRTHDGVEVDFVVERMDGGVVGFEFKSDTRVPGKAFHGLRQLRDKLGDSFLGGVVLYGGERSYTYDDRLHAAPIDRLWALR